VLFKEEKNYATNKVAIQQTFIYDDVDVWMKFKFKFVLVGMYNL
jgi:hypothetical protein